MSLAREGYPLIVGAGALALVTAPLGPRRGGAWWVPTALGAAALGFTAWFFRDPARTPPEGAAALVLAPADGKVIEIVEEDEPIYLKGPGRRISIFLSPLNVHVNRVPVSGTVEHVDYFAGEYLVAWHPKASEKNERSMVGMRHPSGMPVLFKQIAGAVARRIVCYAKVGETYSAGDRYGIVKFGSRMDVILPPEVRVDVGIGDRVVAGETVLAHLTPEGARQVEAREEDRAPAPSGPVAPVR
jgi:phosphatidylserine decarboxylase